MDIVRKAGAAVLLWALVAALPPPCPAATKAAYRHFLKALLHQQRGDAAQALQEYEAAAQLDPDSTYILESAAQLAAESGQHARALEYAKRLAALDPKSPKTRILLGNIQWAVGNLAQAREAFEEALKLDPGFGEALYALGNLLSAESPDKAREYFERYLAGNPDQAAEAHYQIAVVSERVGDQERAIEHLRTSIALEPGFLQARYSLAHIYEVRKDTPAALGEYLGILEREPQNVALLNHVGEIHFLRGEADAALPFFERAKAAAPGHPAACLWLAIVAEQKGDFSKAAEQLAQSTALKEDAELHLRLSYYYTQANRLKDAMAVLDKANQRWPENNEVAYFLALGYEDTKAFDKAAKLLQRLLERNPRHRDARFQLAALYEKTGRMADSEREFRLLIEARPNDASALNYLGYSLTDRGMKLPEAEELIRRALGLDPDNGAYRDSLAWSFYKQGRYPAALEEVRAALRLMPEDATLWDHLGDVQSALGRGAEAWEAWKRSLAVDAANAAVQKKAETAEAAIPAGELGTRLVGYLRRVHGGLQSYSGVCEIRARAGGKDFAYNGLLSFRQDGALRIELLGPLFIPVFRLELAKDGSFTMDPFQVQGAPAEAVQETLYQGLSLMREFLGGSAFAEGPAEFKKGWRSAYIVTPARYLTLTDDRHRLGRLQPLVNGVKLKLLAYSWRQGRSVPTQMQLEGRGFSIGIRVADPSVRFVEPAVP